MSCIPASSLGAAAALLQPSITKTALRVLIKYLTCFQVEYAADCLASADEAATLREQLLTLQQKMDQVDRMKKLEMDTLTKKNIKLEGKATELQESLDHAIAQHVAQLKEIETQSEAAQPLGNGNRHS